MMNCPKCGTDSQNAKFCPECGQNLRQRTAEQTFEEKRKALQASGQMYCPNCLSTSFVVYKRDNGYNGLYFYNTSGKLIALLGMLLHKGQREEYGDKCVCQNCGYSWYSKRGLLLEKHRERISKLLGNYEKIICTGIDGAYLHLCEDQIMICLSEKKGCIIPYEELALVDHRESAGPFYGRLSIRDRAHMKQAIPKTFKAAKKDRFTILYAPDYLEGYQTVYSVLKAIAEDNKKAGLF